MSKEISHQEYYYQFGEKVRDAVARSIGLERIQRSEDPHFNDIPLRSWDELHPLIVSYVGHMLREAGDNLSLSSTVCVAKSSAHAMRAEHLESIGVDTRRAVYGYCRRTFDNGGECYTRVDGYQDAPGALETRECPECGADVVMKLEKVIV